MRKATVLIAATALVLAVATAAALAAVPSTLEVDPIPQPVVLHDGTSTVPVTGSVNLDDPDGVCAVSRFDVRVDDTSLLDGGVDPSAHFGWECVTSADWQVDWSVDGAGTYEVVAETVVESDVGSARQLVRQEVVAERP